MDSFLKIIAGNLKGKKLFSTKGRDIRPTSSRLRESLFNILSNRVFNAITLDLFAGTGALGIESLSRGALFSYFIDNKKDAISIINKNINLCSLQKKSKILKWDIVVNLNCIKCFNPKFNLVFMDPPYGIEAIKPTLINLQQSRSLRADACIVVEHSSFVQFPKNIPAFKIMDQRKYSKTTLSFLTHNG